MALWSEVVMGDYLGTLYGIAYKDAERKDCHGLPWILCPFVSLEDTRKAAESLRQILCEDITLFSFPDLYGEELEIDWNYVFAHPI